MKVLIVAVFAAVLAGTNCQLTPTQQNCTDDFFDINGANAAALLANCAGEVDFTNPVRWYHDIIRDQCSDIVHL